MRKPHKEIVLRITPQAQAVVLFPLFDLTKDDLYKGSKRDSPEQHESYPPFIFPLPLSFLVVTPKGMVIPWYLARKNKCSKNNVMIIPKPTWVLGYFVLIWALCLLPFAMLCDLAYWLLCKRLTCSGWAMLAIHFGSQYMDCTCIIDRHVWLKMEKRTLVRLRTYLSQW